MKKIIIVLVGILSLTFTGTAYAAETFNKDLRYGQTKNTEVKHLQQFLKDQGYYKFDITGNYFLITKTAVKNFQIENNLKATGNFDKITRGKVNEIVENKETISLEPSPEPSISLSPDVQSSIIVPTTNQLTPIITPQIIPPTITSNTNPIPPSSDKKALCITNVQNNFQSGVSSIRNFNTEIAEAQKELDRRKNNYSFCLSNLSVGSFWDIDTQKYVTLGEAISKNITSLTPESWCAGNGDGSSNWLAEVQDAEQKYATIIKFAQDFKSETTKHLENDRDNELVKCENIR